MSTETKKCPYCGEEISINAKKCIHCKEWLDQPLSPTNMAAPEQPLSPACQERQSQVTYLHDPYHVRPPQFHQFQPQQQVIVTNNGQQSNGAGTAGFVLALISTILFWLPGVNWVTWFLGALFSFIGLFKSPRGMAIAGFILSFIDLIILVAVVGAIASIFA